MVPVWAWLRLTVNWAGPVFSFSLTSSMDSSKQSAPSARLLGPPGVMQRRAKSLLLSSLSAPSGWRDRLVKASLLSSPGAGAPLVSVKPLGVSPS
jgi:hypothetical protein